VLSMVRAGIVDVQDRDGLESVICRLPADAVSGVAQRRDWCDGCERTVCVTANLRRTARMQALISVARRAWTRGVVRCERLTVAAQM
jgi:hypothetical protein